MNFIVSVDKNWGIGWKNRLLVSIPADMKFFREMTTGKVVIFGRKTLATFPNGLPLKNRTNIVLSTHPDFCVKDARTVHSIPALLNILKDYDPKDVFCIGGESVYRQLLPYCDTVHATCIDYAFEADAHFPNLDQDPDWYIAADREEQTCFDLEFTWRMYRRKGKERK